MKRIHALLSILLVALVSGAWVIKDTANPVDIYTGSNTTPTISGATSGAVTVGPTNFTGIHRFYGDADFTAMGGGGLEFFRIGEPVTGRLFISASGDTLVLGTETAHGLDLRTNNTSVLAATSAGAVTAGYLTGGASTALSVKGTGSSTMVVDRTSSVGALVGIEFQGGGTKSARILSNSTDNFSFESGAGSTIASATAAGAWTIGPSGFNGIHVVNGLTRFDENLAITFGSQRPGFYFVNTNGGGGSTCTSNCSSGASGRGINAGGEQCMYAWTSGNAISACGTTLVSGKCLCVGID